MMGALMRRHCTKPTTKSQQKDGFLFVCWGKMLLFYWRMNVWKLELNCWNGAHKCVVLYGLIRNYNFIFSSKSLPDNVFFFSLFFPFGCVVCACFAAHNEYNNILSILGLYFNHRLSSVFSFPERERTRKRKKNKKKPKSSQNDVRKKKERKKKTRTPNDSREKKRKGKSLFLKSIARAYCIVSICLKRCCNK